jgi:hypothetical protein
LYSEEFLFFLRSGVLEDDRISEFLLSLEELVLMMEDPAEMVQDFRDLQEDDSANV